MVWRGTRGAQWRRSHLISPAVARAPKYRECASPQATDGICRLTRFVRWALWREGRALLCANGDTAWIKGHSDHTDKRID